MKIRNGSGFGRQVAKFRQLFVLFSMMLFCFAVGSYFHGGPGQLDKEDKQHDCNFNDDIFREKVKQTDPCLIAAVKKKILLPCSKDKEQYATNSLVKDIGSNIEKFKWVEGLLLKNNMPGLERDARWPGFFIECGANDGEFISPTINLERKYNWTGLLVEANPTPFKKLMEKKRNAWAANVAACTNDYAEQLMFYTDPGQKSEGRSGLNARPNVGITENFTVQCIPMYTMLAALNVNVVDYLSLDVEGFELDILKTIPFDRIMFKIMTIEYVLVPGKQKALQDFLEPKGYKFVKEITDRLTKDCLYVHKSLYKKAMSLIL